MPSHNAPPSGHTYPSISLGDSSQLHAGDLNIYVDKRSKSQEDECHQCFKTSTYEDYKNRNIDRAEGTCQWVLTHPHFISWRQDTSQSLLWISADPGCGKSVLAKALVDRDLQDDGQSTICYFFFKDNEVQDNLPTALCALLHQLFAQQPQLIRHALPMWKKNGDMLRKEIGDIWHVVQQCAQDPNARPIICVLDALDECRDDDRRRLISLLCDLLLQSSDPVKRRIKFLVTSRPYNNVQKWFNEAVARWPHIRVRGEDENEQIRQEINLVIEQNVQTLAQDFSLTQQHCTLLKQRLLQMQHRTYLWLHLAMEEITEVYQSSLYPDEEEIPSIPDSVDQAYHRILQKIKPKQVPVARKILLIILGARRPLTIGELALALAAAKPQHKETGQLIVPETSHLEKQIRDWCGLFIYIQHSTLFLIHQTAKEFLLSNQSQDCLRASMWRGSFAVMEVENAMAKLCVMYLCVFAHSTQQRQIELRNVMRGNTTSAATVFSTTDATAHFYDYCLDHWTSHFQDQMAVEDPQLADRVLRLYDTECPVFVTWFARFWNNLRPAYLWWDISSQHAIAFVGHKSILELLHDRCAFDVNAVDGTSNTALWYAANQGHAQIVERLFDLGANIQSERPLYGSALRTAVEQRHGSVVQLLMKRGAQSVDLDPLYISAARRGDTEFVQFLHDIGFSTNACDRDGATAVDLAIQHGHEETMEVLLAGHTDVRIRPERHRGSLRRAAVRNQEKIVSFLCTQGVDVNARSADIYPATALHGAARGGYEDVVRILLENGAHVDVASDEGTPLLVALKNHHVAIAKMLLGHGADVNAQSSNGAPPLWVALQHGHTEIAKMLLGYGADINARPWNGVSPLYAALENDYLEIAKWLIGHGADINTQPSNGAPPLWVALQHGHTEIAKMLLGYGADINAGPWDGLSPLCAALENDRLETAKMLIGHGADVNFQARYGYSPLFLTSNVELAEMLIRHGADIHARSRAGTTPLLAASRDGHIEVAEVLIGYGADLDARSKSGYSPLLLALGNGHLKLAKILVGKGADVNARPQDKHSPLLLALKNGHLKFAEILVQNGADVNGRPQDDYSPLVLALKKNHYKLAEILVQKGADVNARPRHGCSPLLLALKNGHLKLVEMMIQQGVAVNTRPQDEYSPLLLALRNDHFKLAGMLIRKGADVSTRDDIGNTLFTIAMEQGFPTVVQMLIGRESVSNSDGLVLASRGGQEQVVEMVQSNGPFSATCTLSDKALAEKLLYSYEKVVEELLSHLVNGCGTSLYLQHNLSAALWSRDDSAAALSLAKGVDMIEKDGGLHCFTLVNRWRSVQLLLDNGVNVNSRWCNKTALHVAIQCNYKKIAELLLDRGADVNARDGRNRTAISYANTPSHEGIRKSLLVRGAFLSRRPRTSIARRQRHKLTTLR